MRTLLVLLNKEFRQFFRNPFLPKVTIIFPMMVMLVIPWITTMDVRHVEVAVVDNDHSSASRRLVQKIEVSDYFTLYAVCGNFTEALRSLEAGEVDVIVEIPADFEHDLTTDTPGRVNISANGVNAIKGSLGTQYLIQTVSQTLAELRAEQGLPAVSESITMQNRYNPTLEYRYYMIPALMIMLLIMLCGFMPALNIVGEKETGTIEQINVTPVSRFTFTLAKLIPFWVIGLVVLSLAMLLAWLVYGLVPAGNLGAIYLAALLFILTMSGIGVVIANKSDTMQQTMFVMFFFVMLFVLMSGLITPIESMPDWAQTTTRFLPPRYFVEIMRAIYLKGTMLCELWMDYLALALFAVIMNMWAALSYKKQT